VSVRGRHATRCEATPFGSTSGGGMHPDVRAASTTEGTAAATAAAVEGPNAGARTSPVFTTSAVTTFGSHIVRKRSAEDRRSGDARWIDDGRKAEL
jgi:hypothetical protein